MSTGRVALVGTQRGLFRIAAGGGDAWRIDGPLIEGYEILHAWLHPHDAALGYAAVRHPVWGAHVYRSEDGGRSWASLHAVPGAGTEAIWYLAPGGARDRLYAGTAPPGLFESGDGGASWSRLDALDAHPTRALWEPARGYFALHSIHVAPDDPRRLYVAVSAGGAYRSDDAGARWRPINAGVPLAHRPGDDAPAGHNIHRLVMHPARPDRLYRQCYEGTWRSDDGGAHWHDITAGLPGSFGYAILCDPRDPDTVFVVPHESNHMRVTVGGRLRVYRSRDAGASWQALAEGLPQRHAYLTVLREALACDAGDPAWVYLGTTGGHLFASRDGGTRWVQVAGYLPRILSVSAASS